MRNLPSPRSLTPWLACFASLLAALARPALGTSDEALRLIPHPIPGNMAVTNTFTNGICLIEGAGDVNRCQLAINMALYEVRAVWLAPNGGLFVATHRGSQVWYVDTDGLIHLFLHGDRNGAHAGDGSWFYQPGQPRVSEVRAVTMDHDGNLLITENDIGFIRKVEFLPFQP